MKLHPEQAKVFVQVLEDLQLASGRMLYFSDDDHQPPAPTFRDCCDAIQQVMLEIENTFCRLDRAAYGRWLQQQREEMPKVGYEPCPEWFKT